MKNYILYNKTIIGSGHIKEKKPCQDYSIVLKNNGVYFAMVSDGSGSSSRSELASKYICEELSKKVCKEFDSLVKKEEYEGKKAINDFVSEKINELAKQNDLKIKDLRCTYLFVAFKDNQYVIGRLGDGGIVILLEEDDWSLLEETKIETVEKTHYFDNGHYDEYMDFEVGEDKLVGAFLFTDGFYDGHLSDELSNIINQNYIKGLSILEEEEIIHKFDTLLSKRQEKTNDDISIAVISVDKHKKPERQRNVVSMTKELFKKIFSKKREN